VVLVGRIEAQDVHVESCALFDQGQAYASGTDDGYSLAGDFVAEERKVGMPVAPAIFAGQMFGGPKFAGERAHQEESKLGGRFGQDVGGVRERDFVLVSVSTIDVVEADGELRYDFESTLSGGEDFGVDGIAEGGDQAIDAGLHFLDDQAFRRSLRTG